MTYREFDDINSWDELLAFCRDYDCDICDDIVDAEDMDEYVDSEAQDYLRDYPWYELRDILNDIPSRGDYFRRNGSLEYYDVTDEFEDYKNEVLDYLDANDFWDEDDVENENGEEPHEYNEEDEYDDEEEDYDEPSISLGEFLTSSVITVN